ncbi:hypothetical protein [Pannonibacter sp. SL95]|uniref:hypothetical protein n=1 Tax=Pannonibacter sp. SL95 TaxID=2995153 RepID=UPI002274EF3B|nr:hypothetical protein [Pannonibacter sp. SL95]MCY1707410.1 hypothetical protein [Pannonibacter sp. SL95]
MLIGYVCLQLLQSDPIGHLITAGITADLTALYQERQCHFSPLKLQSVSRAT